MKKSGGIRSRAHGSAGTTEDVLRQAALALQSGQPQSAERLAREALGKRRDHPGALQLLGMTLLAQDRPEDAVGPLEQAARSNPGAAVETYLAIALRGTGRPAEALQWLRRASERQPPLPHALYELGTLLHAQGQSPEAEAVLKRGMQISPGVAEFSIALGGVFLDRGDFEDATAAFGQALATAPGHPAALQGSACLLMARGEFEHAAVRLHQVLRGNPSNAKAQLLLASCLFELGKSTEAIERLRALMGTTPQLFGQALKACVEAGRGRLWLKPSAAAEFFGVKKNG